MSLIYVSQLIIKTKWGHDPFDTDGADTILFLFQPCTGKIVESSFTATENKRFFEGDDNLI